MNLDRCAWNGKHESYDYSTFVCGKSVLGVYRNCTNVCEYKRNGEWREYNRTASQRPQMHLRSLTRCPVVFSPLPISFVDLLLTAIACQ